MNAFAILVHDRKLSAGSAMADPGHFDPRPCHPLCHPNNRIQAETTGFRCSLAEAPQTAV
jgi:hypothetical protein